MPIETRMCKHCGGQFKSVLYPSTIKRGARGEFCSTKCANAFNWTGKTSPNSKGGRLQTDRGYVWVYAPRDPHARRSGYALEHRIVMAGVLGRRLLRHEVVHHINGNKADNRPENLELLASQADHAREHGRLRREARTLVAHV